MTSSVPVVHAAPGEGEVCGWVGNDDGTVSTMKMRASACRFTETNTETYTNAAIPEAQNFPTPTPYPTITAVPTFVRSTPRPFTPDFNNYPCVRWSHSHLGEAGDGGAYGCYAAGEPALNYAGEAVTPRAVESHTHPDMGGVPHVH